MKLILLTLLLVSSLSFNSFSQENKSTLDRALETTNGIIGLFDKNKSANTPKNNLEVSLTAKFSIINSTGKRISMILKSASQSYSFEKSIVLGIDDRESISNLQLGVYTYIAKFEDGNIAKSGDVEFTADNLSIDKVIK
jgi:hypothetical protein